MGVGFDNLGVDVGNLGLSWGFSVAQSGVIMLNSTYLEDSSARIPHLETQAGKLQLHDYNSQVLQTKYHSLIS